MTRKKDWSAPVLRVGGRVLGRRLLFPVSSLLSNLSSLARRRRANWAYRERRQLVSRSPQVLGGDQTIPENKTCSRRGGAFVSAGLVADVVRRSMADGGKRPVGHPRRKVMSRT